MRRLYLIASFFLFLIEPVHSQFIRPSVTVNASVQGSCSGCQILGADNAWDLSLSTYAEVDVSVGLTGGSANVIYQFANPVPRYNTIKLTMKISGTGILSGLASAEIFRRISVQLQNSTGTALATYNNINPVEIHVLSASENIFEVTIINSNPATQRIRIQAGDLLSLGLTGRDIYIYDVRQYANDIHEVTTAEASGKVNALLCVLCSVINREHATSAYDLNKDYANFNVPLSLNLASGYLYSRYTWGGTTFSGSDYDIYILLQNDEILSLGTELLFFQGGNIGAEVTYSDGTKVVYDNSNALITANLLGIGSGRMYLKINANDSKQIEKVEIRFGGNLLGVLNNLRLYSIFVAGSNPFIEPDVEAVYTVETPRPVSEHTVNNVVATAVDGNGLIVSAVANTPLPAGLTLAADGTIRVSNPATLPVGTFPVTITTTDIKGGTTVNIVVLTFHPADIEAIYVVAPAKPINDLIAGSVLATVTDGNGPIISAVVTTGTLPAGTTIAANGTITVSNAAALVAATTNIQITTTDDKGGTTVSPVSIVINTADIEAVYTVNPFKPLTDLLGTDVLATVTDANAPIISATVQTGVLPLGTTLAANGTISISNLALVGAGVFPLQILTTDNKGGTTLSTISITIHPPDIEAIYVVNPAKPINDYINTNILATVTDANGPIVSAVVTTGTLPPGTAIATNGTITVSNAAALISGTTNIQITTTDDKGGTTVSTVSLIINVADIEAVYVVAAVKPVTDHIDGNILATVTDANGPIVSAVITTGTLPPGTSIAANGTITVSSAAVLAHGSFNLQITTTDDKGGTTLSNVILVIGVPDIEAVYTINPAKPVNDYTNGNVVATVTDANGPIVNAVVTTGILPAGMAIAVNGTITVTNAAALVAGTTAISITTTDNHGGTTVSNISLVIHPTDIEAIYTVVPAKSLDEYIQGFILATVTDGNGAIVSAVVTTGTLAPGMVITADGTIQVSILAQLVAGTTNVQVTTTDIHGGITVSPVSIIIKPADHEAVYTVNPTKTLNLYANADVLATVTDTDGGVVNAVLTTGTLPPGTTLAANGTITVTNVGLLIQGSFPVTITTTDANGGTTLSAIVLLIDPSAFVDIEAVYTVNPAKPSNDYSNGNVLASATDGNGPIVSAVVSTGSLPPGTSLAANGTITVTNAAVVVAGTTNLSITTTDDKTGTTISAITLIIHPADQEAVYTVNPAKPVNDYVNGNTLATVTDANGPIVSAVVTSGNLPPGTTLLANGTINVSNATILAPGTYTAHITTTDDHGGTTSSEVTIIINASDIEAIYVVLAPKPVNDYTNAQNLATVTDANGTIVLAVVTTGTLPAGTAISANGTISVLNTSQLVAGTTNLSISTTDNKGGVTISNIVLVIHPADQEAVYTINPAKPVNDYTNGNILATVTDPNGPIVSAVVTSGSLPPGTVIHNDGSITVSNPALLAPGTYNFQVTTTDDHGGTTTSTVSLIIHPADIEAVYTVAPSKPVNDYTNGFTLASATDANGPIVNTVLATGTLPAGTALAANGTITVSNVTLLIAGSYPLQITTTDDKGGVTNSTITIVINPTDIEAVYTVNPAKPVNDYVNGNTLATVTDGNGPIVSAVVTSGSLPPGTTLATNGTITVNNTSALQAGTYNFQVTTTDDKGGVTISNVSIVIHPTDIEAVYAVNHPKPSNDYVNGNPLATATDANGAIVSAVITTGTLPPGTSIAADGTISVSNATLIAAGTTSVQVTTTDIHGGISVNTVTLVIHPSDQEAVYTILPAKTITDYVIGNTIATVTDPNGPIISAVVTTGTLPPGLVLQSDGTIKVSDPSALVPGSYTITITTTDVNGGTTVAVITIILTNENIKAGLAKTVGTPILTDDGTYIVPFTLFVKNYGNVKLEDIQITDNLTTAFPAPATFTVLQDINVTGGLVLNTAYNGSTNTSLLTSGSVLDVGATAKIIFRVEVNLHGGPTQFNNSATVTTRNATQSLTYTDISDDGNNPDPNGNNEPNESGENDPTVISLKPTPVLGVAKIAGTPLLKPDNTYDIQYTITLENLGNETLTNLKVNDNLDNTFPIPATYSLIGGVSVTGFLIPSTTFNGSGDTNLLGTGSTLAVGSKQNIVYKVNVNTHGTNVPFFNSALGSGDGSGGTSTDVSTNGDDPDPNGNGNPSDPGEDTSTGVALTPNLVAGIAKNATVVQSFADGSYKINYALTVENFGNIAITDITVTDNLSQAFPSPATFELLPGTAANGTLRINPDYNGVTDINLLLPTSTLALGASHTIHYSVVVYPEAASSTFYNSAIVRVVSGNLEYVDISDDGFDPDPNSNGDPTEPGENDPSRVSLTPNPVIGLAKAAGVPLVQPDGSFMIEYILTLENLGSVVLNDMQVKDNLSLAFPAPAEFSVTTIATSGSLTVNPAFNGHTDTSLLVPGNKLLTGQTEQVRFVVRVDPHSSGGSYANSAYATATGISNSGQTSDFSNAGFEPDPNGNSDPGDADEDTPTVVTLDVVPIIGLAKSASPPLLQPNGTFDVTFTFTLQNLGNAELANIRLEDDLALTFPSPITFTVKTAPQATGTLVANSAFNGNGVVALLNGTSTLAVGGKETVTVVLNVDPNGVTTTLHNSAIAYASNEDGTRTYTDISTNGLIPDPNGNGNPSELTESITTPVTFQPIPIIGIANRASAPVLNANGRYSITFTITVENLGNEILNNITIESNLLSTFPAPMSFSVMGTPITTGNLTIASNFNGSSNIVLISDGTLGINEQQTIQYTIEVSPNNIFGTFWQQPVGQGTGATTLAQTFDMANDGDDADTDRNGRADEWNDNRPTPITLISNSIVGLAKTVTNIQIQQNCSYNVTYTFTLENYGNAGISDIQVHDDLSVVFPSPVGFSIVSLTASSGLITNSAYNGAADKNLLLAGSTLASNSEGTITLTINVQPNNSYGPFNNTSTLMATTPEGWVEDISNNMVADPNNDGIPNEQEPTVLEIDALELFIPEGFSPNGDGNHDLLEITLTCGLSAKLSVFNRWGDLIYFSRQYQNDWNGYSNQGRFAGTAVPDGTYFYTAELSNGRKITSFFTIKR